MNDGWSWRVGFLSGYGEAFWQQLNDKVRKITKAIAVPGQGVAFMKALASVTTEDSLPQWEAQGFVIEGKPVREEVIEDLKRTWGESMIAPVNGARIQLQ